MSDLSVGGILPPISHPPISQSQLNAYSEASGDSNRIHLDEAVAKSMGLPGIIAHGMLSAAFLAERAHSALLSSVKYRSFKPHRFQSRFKAMVFLGDVVSVGGSVKEATDVKIIFDLVAKNQKGETVTTATIEFVA